MLQNNAMQDQWIEGTNPLIKGLKEWTIPYTKYTGQYDVVLEADSIFAEMEKKIKEGWGITLPLLLLSESEEEFDQILENYKDVKYEMGYEKLLVEYTRIMKKNKEKLGLD